MLQACRRRIPPSASLLLALLPRRPGLRASTGACTGGCASASLRPHLRGIHVIIVLLLVVLLVIELLLVLLLLVVVFLLLIVILLVIVLLRVDGRPSEPRDCARHDPILDDAAHLVVVLQLLMQLVGLLLIHVLVVVGHLSRVKEVEEGVGRLLHLNGAELALLLLLFLHYTDGDVLALFPLDVRANGPLQAPVLVSGVQKVCLCENLVLEVRVLTEDECELEARLAWPKRGRILDVLEEREHGLVHLLDFVCQHHMVGEAREPKARHAGRPVDDV
mmetsp:Transcript_22566/g.72968  ORF Transcript_22566/g.72968 Transcript_22566/m.72968 type:complete len:276 (+) Transcript_22566:353-1180(+)